MICGLNYLFGLKGKGGGVEESRVELAKNKLLLGQIYSTLLPSPSIQTDHKYKWRKNVMHPLSQRVRIHTIVGPKHKCIKVLIDMNDNGS